MTSNISVSLLNFRNFLLNANYEYLSNKYCESFLAHKDNLFLIEQFSFLDKFRPKEINHNFHMPTFGSVYFL